MTATRTRLIATSGATLALVVAGSAVATAHPHDEWAEGFGRGQMRDRIESRLERRAEMLDRMQVGLDQFIRREITVDLGDAGIVTYRTDHGTVTSTSETELAYSLATGETATVVTGEDTVVWTVVVPDDEATWGPLRRPRMMAEELALSDIAADSEVTVWATSQDDGTFLAGRIVVHPAAETSLDEATDESAVDDTETGASTDAEASPEAAPADA